MIAIGIGAHHFSEGLAIGQSYASVVDRLVSGGRRVAIVGDGIGLALAFMALLNPLLAAGIHVTSELVFILNSAKLIR